MIKKATLFGHPEGYLVITPAQVGLYIFREKGGGVQESGKYLAWDRIYAISIYFSKRNNAFVIKRRNGKTTRWVDQVMFEPELLPEVAQVLYDMGGTGAPPEERKVVALSEEDALIRELQGVGRR